MGNGLRGIKLSRDRSRHVTLKGHSRDPNCDPNALRAQYLENSWRCYLSTIANYCCEAVWSAILETASLLVYVWLRLITCIKRTR